MKKKEIYEILTIFFIVLIALLYKRYDAFVRPQLFAEGFPILFQQNESLGLKTLITPYSGYLLTFARLMALIIGAFHINYLYIPTCYNYCAFLVTFLVCVSIWNIAYKLNIKRRILYSTVFLLLPISSELFMELVSTQWIIALYMVNYIFAWNNKIDEKYYYFNVLMLFIISISGPYSTLVSPVVLLILIVERKQTTLKRMIPMLVILLGGTIQLICIKFIDPNFYRGVKCEPDHFHLMKLFTKNVSEIFFMNSGLLPEMSPRLKTILSLIILAALTYLFIKNYLKIKTHRKYVLLLVGIIMFASFIQAYWPTESMLLSLENVRYYFIPYSCICWLMIIALDEKIKVGHVFVYIFFLLLHSRFIRMILPDKEWQKQIIEYYEGKRTEIDINPEGWHFPMYRKK